MSDNTLWYGYLEAGERSSPVAIDNKLATGDPTTVYMFNLKRGEIIEYKRAIVDPKLRELTDDEQATLGELKSGYRKARNGFTPRGARASTIPERGRAAPAKAAQPAPSFESDETFDDDDAFLDEESGADDSDE